MENFVVLVGLKIIMCLLVQHDRRWRHMSNFFRQHRLQNRESVIKELMSMVVTHVSPISKSKCLCDLGI